MKLIMMFGLAALVAMAAMASVGAGSASAFHLYSYCSQPEWLCASVNIIRLRGRPLWRLIGATSFKGTVEEKCKEGMAKGSETKEELEDEGGMESTIESLTFSGCEPCTTVSASVPIKSNASMPSEEEEEKWSMTLSGFSVNFSGCPSGLNANSAARSPPKSKAKKKEGCSIRTARN